jgi:hypothetical protein
MSILFLLNSAIYYDTHHKVNSNYWTRQGNRNTQNSSGKGIYKLLDNGFKRDNILEFLLLLLYILQLFYISQTFTRVLYKGLRSHSICENKTAVVISFSCNVVA